MTTKEFLTIAREKIPQHPQDRLSPLAKTTLAEPNAIIDIHTHIFDKKCLSVWYIAQRMLKSSRLGKFLMFESMMENGGEPISILNQSEENIYKNIEAKEESTKEDWEAFEKELAQLEKTEEKLEDLGVESFGSKLKDIFSVFRKNDMLEMLEHYHNHFSIAKLEAFKDKKVVLGILQMDLETAWGFTPERNFKQQILDIKEIAKKHPILPYFAVDPRRADKEGADDNLYELFLKAFVDDETPFFGVKCYPAMGYVPYDTRLDPIFQICAEKGIPVLTHCGGEAVSTFETSIEIEDESGRYQYEIEGENRKLRARHLSEPHRWEKVLQKYPELRINFGHLGGSTRWKDYVDNGKSPRLEKLFEYMTDDNLNVYGDFSYGVVEELYFEKFKKVLDEKPDIHSKILYGTDYWVVLPAGELMTMQEKFLKALAPYQERLLKTNVMNYLNLKNMNDLQSYLETLEITPAEKSRDLSLELYTTLESNNQTPSYLNYNSLLSFSKPMDKQVKDDVLNSLLLAQRAASKAYPSHIEGLKWYEKYFEVLGRLGWLIGNKEFNSVEIKNNKVELDKAIFDFISSILPTQQVNLLLKSLDLLKKLGDDDRRLVAFERNSHTHNRGNFQLGLIQQDDENNITVMGSGFLLQSQSDIKRILFVKIDSDNINIQLQSYQATYNPTYYNQCRDLVTQKLGRTDNYIASLDI